MSFVNVDPSEQANIVDSLYTEPEGQPESPGFFSGSLKAPFTGALSGIAKADQMVNDATSVLTKPLDVGFDNLFGTTNAEEADAQAAATTQAAIKYFTPDPQTTGFAGNILHGLGEMVPLAATGNVIGGAAGAAGVLGSVEGYSTYKEAREQGRDTLTAAGEGVITGALNAAGAYLPMSFGSSIIKNLPFGAAMNVAQGTLARGAIHSWLAERGYPEAAEQYKWLDGGSMAVDAVLGAAFGYIGAHEEASPHGVKPTREPLPSDVDAALTLNDAIHTEIDSAPGIPTDIASRQQHNDAMQIATAQLLKGEPINVEGALDGATFEPKPHEVEMLKAIKTALDQSGYGDILQAIDEQTAKAKEMGVEPPADEALPRISGVTETLPDDTETATGATQSEQPISQGRSAGENAPEGANEIPPSMKIPDETGEPMKAADAVQQATEESQRASEDSKAFQAAVDCYTKGGV